MANDQSTSAGAGRPDPRVLASRPCEHCGESYLRWPNNPKQRFCSRACHGKAAQPYKPRKWRFCGWCGQPFCPYGGKPPGGLQRKRKFCGRPCAGKWRGQFCRGEKASGWQGGRASRDRCTGRMMVWKAVRSGRLALPPGVEMKDALDVPEVRAWVEARRRALKPRPPAEWVYFVEETPGGAVKIGCASNVRRRLEDLQVSTWRTLRVLGVVAGGEAAEKELHRRFAALLIRREWFRGEAALLDFIRAEAEPYDPARHGSKRKRKPDPQRGRLGARGPAA